MSFSSSFAVRYRRLLLSVRSISILHGKYSDFPHFTVWRSDCGLTQFNNICARPVRDFRQSEPIAESATLTPPYYSGIFCNCETGSGTYGRATANKMWMSRKFFLLPGIFPLKTENHFQKISQKNCAERVLDLLLALARTISITGENDKHHRRER
jgi:hypothetical protein